MNIGFLLLIIFSLFKGLGRSNKQKSKSSKRSQNKMKSAQAQEFKTIINEMVAELEQIKTKPAERQPHRGRSKEVSDINFYDQSYHPEQDQTQYDFGVTDEPRDFKRPSKDKNKDNLQESPRPTEENVVEYQDESALNDLNLLTGPELVDKIEFEEDSVKEPTSKARPKPEKVKIKASEKDVVEFEFEPDDEFEFEIELEAPPEPVANSEEEVEYELEPVPEEPAASELSRGERIKSYLDSAKRYTKRDIYGKAIKYYDLILDLEPEHTEALINKGLLYWNNKKYKLAVEQFDRVLKFDPNNQEALINKAASLNRLGKKKSALKIYVELLSHDETNADAWSNKGVIYFSMDRFSDAEKCFKNAVKHNAFDEESWFNLGFVQEKLGKYVKAKKAYNNVLDINPDNKEAKSAYEQCAKAARREMLSSWD